MTRRRKFRRYEVKFWTLPGIVDEEGVLLDLDGQPPGYRVEYVRATCEFQAMWMVSVLYSCGVSMRGYLMMHSVRCLDEPKEKLW